MGRPRLRRATVHQLDGDAYLQLVEDGRLSFAHDTSSLAAFFARNNAFAVEYELGVFLVVREKRARGSRYWTARAYQGGQRVSSYIGAQVDLGKLREAAGELTRRLAGSQTDGSEESTMENDMRRVVADLLARETDPDRRRAAQALAALAERGR